MNKVVSTILSVSLLCCCFPVWADVPSWQIVPNASVIKFTGTQNNAPISGEFKKFDGDIKFDANNLNESKIKLIVDMNSVSAPFEELSSMLKTLDWFDTATFPQATFESTQITLEKKGFLVKGDLKVRDKKSPIQVEVSLDESAPDKMKLHGTTTVSRTAFGVGQGEWASTSEVKDDVNVNFNIELKR